MPRTRPPEARSESEFDQFLKDIESGPADLWMYHLATNPNMVADFLKFLNLEIQRAQAHAMNLKGPDLSSDLLRLQGGVRALATLRMVVTGFVRKRTEESGRAGTSQSGTGDANAGRAQDRRPESST
jgi:hypothetical protein